MRCVAALAVVLSVGSGACEPIRSMTPDKAFSDTSKDAIVVLRVVPDAYVQVALGRVSPEGWFSWEGATQLWPEDGFIVARVRPTEPWQAYAIVKIRPEQSGVHSYSPDTDQPLIVFTAVPGQINYAGAIQLAVEAPQPEGSPRLVATPATSPKDTDDVRHFLARHYPRVRAPVVANYLRLERMGQYSPWVKTIILMPILIR